VALELIRQALGWRFNHPQQTRLFFLHTDVMSTWWLALIVLTTVLCVATPIKIWNNARIEHRLEEQEKLLLTARVVLRRLLRSRDHFVTLREELESIDEYLDIEVIRFGPQLTVEKQISPDTLDIIVPSMILQPLIENSIKHGFSRKVGGGRIVIRSVRQNGHAVIEVEDDGLGMTEDRLDTALTDGIGLSNVNERLSVIYGATYRVRITSVPNLGTIIRLEIPDMVSAERVTA
jgi:two-component system, LytTR family, sensor kinase